jgi:hypothetical protein
VVGREHHAAREGGGLGWRSYPGDPFLYRHGGGGPVGALAAPSRELVLKDAGTLRVDGRLGDWSTAGRLSLETKSQVVEGGPIGKVPRVSRPRFTSPMMSPIST